MKTLVACGLLLVVAAPVALAAPKKSNNGLHNCESTGTARKNGKDDQGNTVNCLWDTCTYTVIDDASGVIRKQTDYSNARDCTAAKTSPGLVRPPVSKRPPAVKSPE